MQPFLLLLLLCVTGIVQAQNLKDPPVIVCKTTLPNASPTACSSTIQNDAFTNVAGAMNDKIKIDKYDLKYYVDKQTRRLTMTEEGEVEDKTLLESTSSDPHLRGLQVNCATCQGAYCAVFGCRRRRRTRELQSNNGYCNGLVNAASNRYKQLASTYSGTAPACATVLDNVECSCAM